MRIRCRTDKKAEESVGKIKELHAKIGQLTMERDFLEQGLERIHGPKRKGWLTVIMHCRWHTSVNYYHWIDQRPTIRQKVYQRMTLRSCGALMKCTLNGLSTAVVGYGIGWWQRTMRSTVNAFNDWWDSWVLLLYIRRKAPTILAKAIGSTRTCWKVLTLIAPIRFLYRHYVHTDGERVCVSGRDHGLAQSQDPVLAFI